jgi:hypothetical protein
MQNIYVQVFNMRERDFNACTLHLLLFCTMNQQMQINWQFIILLTILILHVSTPLCYLQGARSRYLLNYISMSMPSWWYNLKFHTCFFSCWISMFKIITNIRIVLVIIKWPYPRYNIYTSINIVHVYYRLHIRPPYRTS